jgi:hypothetical protein
MPPDALLIENITEKKTMYKNRFCSIIGLKRFKTSEIN